MATPRVLVLRAPGTNCDEETAFAFAAVGARPERVHVGRILESPGLLAEFQILCIPGGFSYGDDLAAGRILGTQLAHHLSAPLVEFREAGKLILGICNGFQVLMKSGLLLPDDAQQGARASLTWNDSGRFEARWVRLAAPPSRGIFFRDLGALELPVAHAEGKFVVRDPAVLEQLRAQQQIVLRYADTVGTAVDTYPANPNGSIDAIAGICDVTGRVCGLMPHPERFIDRCQHPRWTRGEGAESAAGAGLKIFENAVGYFA